MTKINVEKLKNANTKVCDELFVATTNKWKNTYICSYFILEQVCKNILTEVATEVLFDEQEEEENTVIEEENTVVEQETTVLVRGQAALDATLTNVTPIRSLRIGAATKRYGLPL